MAQVVEAESTVDPSGSDGGLQTSTRDVAVTERRPDSRAEDEVVGPRSTDRERSPSAVATELLADPDEPSLKINVGPGQPEEFRDTESREDRRRDQRRVNVVGCLDQAFDLVTGNLPIATVSIVDGRAKNADPN